MTKTCSRCGQTKPLAAFAIDRKGTFGASSHCRDCKREVNQASRARNPWYAKADHEIKRVAKHEAIEFSRYTCKRISVILETAIDRFERRTQQEAPPYLQALQDVAEAMYREHPPPEPRAVNGECIRCGGALDIHPRGRLPRLCPHCKMLRGQCSDCGGPCDKKAKRCRRCHQRCQVPELVVKV